MLIQDEHDPVIELPKFNTPAELEQSWQEGGKVGRVRSYAYLNASLTLDELDQAGKEITRRKKVIRDYLKLVAQVEKAAKNEQDGDEVA